jgi:hypothetical protein
MVARVSMPEFLFFISSSKGKISGSVLSGAVGPVIKSLIALICFGF